MSFSSWGSSFLSPAIMSWVAIEHSNDIGCHILFEGHFQNQMLFHNNFCSNKHNADVPKI